MDIVLVTNKTKTDMVVKIKNLCSTLGDNHNLIYTGLRGSASMNRNYGLARVSSEIFVMIDDDVEGFYKGWVEDLISPMEEDESIIVTSARLMDRNGKQGPMMGNNRVLGKGVSAASVSGYKGYTRVPTACIAIRNNPLLFDENFIGSGYEDTDYFNRINIIFPDKKIMINNYCELVHLNEQKNQGGEYFEHNKKYYLSLYPDDTTVINQKDWTKRER